MSNLTALPLKEAETPEQSRDQTVAPGSARSRITMLSYNIQVGIASSRYHHYLTQSWKHVLPHAGSLDNLNRIGHLISSFDVVALQEVDAGSLRSSFVNQVEYLAGKARFPFWYHQTNRKIGKLAHHSNGLLSRIRPTQVSEHKLPGLIPGRGAMLVRYGHSADPLVVLLVHLALGRRARMNQLVYISELVNEYKHVVLMGDLNCQPDTAEMNMLLAKTSLCQPPEELCTFPSWRPQRNIDHVLVTPTLEVKSLQVLNHPFSDHLPLAVEIEVPDTVHLAG